MNKLNCFLKRFKFLTEYDEAKGGRFEHNSIDDIIKECIEKNQQDKEKSRRKFDRDSIFDGYIPEGIDVNGKIVSYNPNHQNFVDTSVENNPTTNIGFDKIPVYSVFTRKKMSPTDKRDGNPLLYALKKENGWQFKSEYDRNQIINQISLIIDKFKQMGTYGITVVIPSGGTLNRLMANIVKEKIPNTTIIDDVLWKLTTDEVFDDIIDNNSPFSQYYSKLGTLDMATNQLEVYFTEMDNQRDGYFTYHLIQDKTMRGLVERTLTLSRNYSKYIQKINDKNILIIDDSIHAGRTFTEACNIIQTTFSPKSITGLTLFSQLKK